MIAKSKSKFSPSPIDQVPYEVFKKCPSLALALADLFSLCWKLGQVPSGWKCAVIKLIPKPDASNDPANPSNFRPIALTSCVGKIFTTILKIDGFPLLSPTITWTLLFRWPFFLECQAVWSSVQNCQQLLQMHTRGIAL